MVDNRIIIFSKNPEENKIFRFCDFKKAISNACNKQYGKIKCCGMIFIKMNIEEIKTYFSNDQLLDLIGKTKRDIRAKTGIYWFCDRTISENENGEHVLLATTDRLYDFFEKLQYFV